MNSMKNAVVLASGANSLRRMNDACNYVFQGDGEVNVDMCDVKYDCKDKVICDKGFCAMSKNVTTTCGNPGDVCPTGQFCMGVQFIELSAQQREQIVNLVRTFAYLSDDEEPKGNS